MRPALERLCCRTRHKWSVPVITGGPSYCLRESCNAVDDRFIKIYHIKVTIHKRGVPGELDPNTV